jgi:multidrug efflux pump subunit AcrA (membrane-fusion protein)
MQQDDPDRRMFDRLMKSEAASFRSPRDAEVFLRAASNYDDKYQLIARMASTTELGRQRLTEAAILCNTSELVNGALLSFLKTLQDPKLSRGTCTQLLNALVLVIVDAPGVLDKVADLAEAGRLTTIAPIGWFVLQAIRARADTREHRAVRRLVVILEGSDVPEARQIAVLLGTSDIEVPAEGGLPGGRHDNDHPDFRFISIIPTVAEIQCNDPYLPNRDTNGATVTSLLDDDSLEREAALLDRQFRLLREDMVGSVRHEINGHDSRAVRFTQASVTGVLLEKGRPACVLVTAYYPQGHRIRGLHGREKLEFAKNAKRILPRDSLVCLMRNDVPVLFGVVRRREAEDLAMEKHSLQVGLAPADGNFDPFLRLVGDASGDLVLMTASSSFFSYEPVLRSLQEMDFVPFAEEIVHVWEPAPAPDMDIGEALVEELFGFDDSQRRAIDAALDQRVSLIQGPPGTGKTYVGAFLARAFVASGDDTILCVCYTNHALDQFLEALLKAGIKQIVRLGGGCKSQILEPYRLERGRSELSKAEGRRLRELFALKDELQRDIADMSEQLSKAGLGQTLSNGGWAVVKDRYPSEVWACFRPQHRRDQFRLAGAAGKPDYLWKRWLKGQGQGDLKGQVAAPTYPEFDVWPLSLADRRTCALEWEEEYVRGPLLDRLSRKLRLYQETDSEIKQLQRVSEVSQLRAARVIGCTTTGASINRTLLDEVSPSIVIVEEAAEILEAHVLTSIGRRCDRLVMIGDHKQLRPKIDQHRLSVESGLGYDLNRSLFERMALRGFPMSTLETQHRMRPELSAIVRAMTYPELKDAPRVSTLPDRVKGLASSLVFIDHHFREAGDGDGSLSKTNKHEADMVTGIIGYLHKQGYAPGRITVLTPYLGQLLVLRKCILAASPGWGVVLGDLDREDLRREGEDPDAAPHVGGASAAPRETVRVATIDNFQGEEADIIVASLVRSNPEGNVGFMSEPERVNVLFSRARFGMIVLGDLTTFAACRKPAGRAMWAKLIALLGRRIYEGLPAVCVSHGTHTSVSSPSEFGIKVPDGGCTLPCGVQLPGCNHPCPLRCHVYDEAHQGVVCRAVVETVCRAGHLVERECSDPAREVCKTCNMLEKIEREAREAEERAQAEHRRLRDKAEIEQRDAQRRRADAEMRIVRGQQLREEKFRTLLAKIEADKLEKLEIARRDGEAADLEAAARDAEAQADNDIALARAAADREMAQLEQKTAAYIARSEARAAEAQQRIADEQRAAAETLERQRAESEARLAAAKEQADAAGTAARAAAQLAALQIHDAETAAVAKFADERRRQEEAASLALAGRDQRIEVIGTPEERQRLANVSRQCCVCFEEHRAMDGLACSGPETHYTCDECFGGHVRSEGSSGETRDARVFCPYRRSGCASEAFSDQIVARHVEPDTFQVYMDALKRVTEVRLAKEMEEQKKQEIRLELDRLQRLSDLERRADQEVRAIRDDILTLKCPRCARAFFDFDGCFALTCSCGCGFCAWCLEDCGTDAHRHVAHCKVGKGQVHSNIAAFHDTHRRRREGLLRAKLQRLPPDVQQLVLKILERDLDDLKMRL